MALVRLDDFTRLNPEIFRFFLKQEPLLLAGRAGDCNVMTIGWGGLGSLWGKPAATVYVRPTRHTYGFMEREDYFSICLLSPDWQEQINYCGSVSGRDEDKISQCGFELAYGAGGTPYLAQAELVLICKKIYASDLDPALMLEPGLDAKNYPLKDYHRAYIGEVVEVYQG